MTVLSWRDVATPDMRGIQDGFGAAADLFTSGMGALRGTVKDLKDQKVNSQSTALLSEIAAIQDPAEIEKQMPSILAKYDPRYIDQGALKTAMSRPVDLLKQAADKSTYLESQKLIKDSDFIRDQAGLINQFKNLPSGPARDEFLLKHKDTFDQMHPRAFQDMLEDRLTINSRELSNYGTALGNLSAEANYKDGRQDRGESRGMELLKSELSVLADHGARQRFMNNPDNFKRIAEDPNYGPQVAARMRGLLNGDISEGAGGIGGGGSAAGGGGVGAGGKNVYDVLLGDGQGAGGGNKYGFDTGKPLSSMSMGELYDYQRSTMVPKTAALGVGDGQGSSAAGAYQIVSKTLARVAPKVFGAGWRDMKFDAAAQDQLGEYLFNEAKSNGTDLHEVWEGLPAGTSPEGKTWAQVRDQITLAESGGLTSAQAREAGIVTETAIDASIGGSQITDTIREVRPMMADSRSNEAVAILAANGELANGVFKGLDRGLLTNKIVEIKNRAYEKYKKKPSAAAVIGILERASNGEQAGLVQAVDWLGNKIGASDGLPTKFDDAYIDNALGLLLDPKKAGKVGVDLDRAAQARGKPSQASALLAQIEKDEQAAIAQARKTGQTVDFKFFADQRAAVQNQAGGLVDAGGREAVRQVKSKFPAETTPPTAPNSPTRKAPPPAAQPPVNVAGGGGIRLPKETEAVREQAMYAMANPTSQAAFKQRYGILPQQFLNNLRFQLERRRPVATKPAVAPAPPPADIAKFNQLLAAQSGNMLVKR